jgi:glutamate-1-semialdehyde 2,1-aminomutase
MPATIAEQYGRQFAAPAPFERSRGALVWDAQGNEFIDYSVAGMMLLGHAHPAVRYAVQTALPDGLGMVNSAQEQRWEQAIMRLMPAVERVQFTPSGTAASLLALRIARAHTGRSKIVKLRGHNIGWHDYACPDDDLNTEAGVPDAVSSTVISIPADLDCLAQVLAEEEIAAVIFEPTGAHWGALPLPNPAFLRHVRTLTERHDVLLVLDESCTGFHLARGGAQERFQVRPDLTILTKAVSAGFGGALGGRADLIGLIWHPSDERAITLYGSGTPYALGTFIGAAVLEVIENEPVVEQAQAMGERLKQGINDVCKRVGLIGHAHGLSPYIHLTFGTPCNCDRMICTLPHATLAQALSQPWVQVLTMAMRLNGILIMGGGSCGFMVSAAHQEAQIDRTVEAFEKSVRSMRTEGLLR